MRVVMTTRIGGFRNGEPWPAPNAEIDLPAHEAADLVAAGYAKPLDEGLAAAVKAGLVTAGDAVAASQPAIDVKRSKKPELLAFAAAHGIDVDPAAGVREIRRTITAHLEERDAPPVHDQAPGGPGAPAGPVGDDDAPAGVEPAVVVNFDTADKGELLDFAADANIAVNPALPTEEIRSIIAAALNVRELIGATPSTTAWPTDVDA